MGTYLFAHFSCDEYTRHVGRKGLMECVNSSLTIVVHNAYKLGDCYRMLKVAALEQKI